MEDRLSPDEDLIRQRAYRLWQDDGSQEGHADDYWYRAATQIAAENATPPSDAGTGDSTLVQSDKRQLEAAVPEEQPDGDGVAVSAPRAKRRRG